MKIPEAVLDLITKEEAVTLVKLYNTDLYQAYINKLKKKYQTLYEFLEEV